MTATPGQRAYEEHERELDPNFEVEYPIRPYAELPESERKVWEETAQAVLNDAFPGLRRKADEGAAAQAALARVLAWFPTSGTRNAAAATRAQLASAYRDGGLTVPEELRRFAR